MVNNEEEIKTILNESAEDLKIKKYLSKIKNIFGDDYALLILSCDYDIGRSINKFSSKFKSINSTHIQFLLLQSALLTNNSKYKDLIEEKIRDNDFEPLFPFIASNMFFRKELARIFIEQCDKTNYELFNKKSIEEKNVTINNILELKRYERFLKVQDEISKNIYTKRRR